MKIYKTIHLVQLCAFIMAFTAFYVEVRESAASELELSPDRCMENVSDNKALSGCLKEIYTILEGKRLILENSAANKEFESKSTIDWNSFYKETLDNSRYFFEGYRKAECDRKEILSSTGFESKHEKLICLIRMTKDRINSLQ